MPWNNDLTNLKNELAELYPLMEDSITIVREAGLRTANIAFKDKATNNWSEILTVADRSNKVLDIIHAALRDYPENPVLLRSQKIWSALKLVLTPEKPIVDNNLNWKSFQPVVDLEKLMGEQTTLLPISWLEVGVQRARSVARVKRVDHTFGTGFLLENNVFLTNNHVLATRDDAKNAILQFNYQQTPAGLTYEPIEFALDPDTSFQTSVKNDWTLVHVKGDANAQWGAIEIASVAIQVNNYANIIQHPAGEPKQIAIYHNIITYVDDTRVQYLTDTLPGSSGSAVFDSQWRLIAIHHAGGSIREPETRKMVYRNEGININCILKDLEQGG